MRMETLLKTLDELSAEDLERFQWFLTTDNVLEGFSHIPKSQLERAKSNHTITKMVKCYGVAGAEKLTWTILKKMNHNNLAEMLESELKQEKHVKESQTGPGALSCHLAALPSKSISDNQILRRELKKHLLQKYERILDSDSETGHKKYVNDIFTELYMVENETGGVIEKHEVRQIEASSNRPAGEEIPINCNDIFKLQADTNRCNRKVLTMGIAGVGKTISVAKFILDWAEGKENQDIDFIFPLPFRELNMNKDKQFSLIELLQEFVLPSNELTSLPSGDGKVMFIFDGLDECRFSLNFDDTEMLRDIYQKTSLDSIITNLIKRNLLPSALIWITSRPAAAYLIPRDYIDQLTEVRGFNDEQRKKFFRRNCKKELAEKTITHIMKSRSLYIMCQIPFFCSISVRVLEDLLTNNEETPTTLTGMYTKFVRLQLYSMETKYGKKNTKTFKSEDVILQLGKLALLNLKKGHLIFYEEDLKECGLDTSMGSVYSGVCTQIFSQNQTASDRKTFSFVHLSIQEFFAALYVLHTHCSSIKRNALQSSSVINTITWSNKTIVDLQMYALNEAFNSNNGHLDLFVRFLFGLCVESNQQDMRRLLPKLKAEMKPKHIHQLRHFISTSLNYNLSPSASLNLLECLNEMEDNSLLLESMGLPLSMMSGTYWSVMLYRLLRSKTIQETFDLKQYPQTPIGLSRLLPVMHITKKALLDNCSLMIRNYGELASVFSEESALRELDLSQNYIDDAGMNLLAGGLRSVHCKLEILRMCFCDLTEQSGQLLASVLTSSLSCLRELDVSNNIFKDRGVKFISSSLENPNCKLEILRLSGCLITREGFTYLASSLSSNSSSHLTVLDLTYNQPEDTELEMFSELLHNPDWKLETVIMDHGGQNRMKQGLLKYACNLTLDPNTANHNLSLSTNYTQVWPFMSQSSYRDHSDRFEAMPQVLCLQPLTGRCYWEVNYSNMNVIMAVTYKRINRKGPESLFGHNDASWLLSFTPGNYTLVHNNHTTIIPGILHPFFTLAVYLDSEAGTLSFYKNINQRLHFLHRLYVKFTEPIYVGFTCYAHHRTCISITHF